MNLTRSQILKGKYDWPGSGSIKGVHVLLHNSTHYLERVRERLGDNPKFQNIKYLKVSRDNIYSGKTKDGKWINSFVIREKLDKNTWIFFCITNHLLKSVWAKKIVYKNRGTWSKKK